MSERRRRSIPFNRRSRTAQKREYWNILRKIRGAATELGGKFYTHQYIHGENGWLDAYFLGLQKPVFYNLSLQTVRYKYKELVENRAWELSFDRVPRDREPTLEERTVKDPVSGLYVTPPHEPYHFDELGGMTRYEWIEAQREPIANSGEFKVFEHWTLHRDYGTGIGLHATIDVPYLTIAAVNDFIERFLKTGSGFQSQEPRSFRFDEITHWGMEPNAICDPWDWNAQPSSEHVADEL
jgi:hypothetical protein